MSTTHIDTSSSIDGATKWLDPVGRVLISAMFFMSGISKIGGYAGTQQYMESAGVPGILLPAVIALEILAPVAIVLGVFARLAAAALAGFAILAALMFHFDFADQMQTILFMKNMAVAGGLLFIVARGPGAFSLGNPNR